MKNIHRRKSRTIELREEIRECLFLLYFVQLYLDNPLRTIIFVIIEIMADTYIFMYPLVKFIFNIDMHLISNAPTIRAHSIFLKYLNDHIAKYFHRKKKDNMYPNIFMILFLL